MNLLERAGSVASVVSLATGLFFQLYKDSYVVTYVAYGSAGVFLITTVILYRSNRSKPNEPPSHSNINEPTGFNRLTGTIDLSSIGNPEKPIQVFYAKKFKSTPCLDLRLRYALGKLEIVEQRSDGFSFIVSWKKDPSLERLLPPGPGQPRRDPSVAWFVEGEFQE